MASSSVPALEISVLATGGFEQLPADGAQVSQLLSKLEAGKAFELSVHPVDELTRYPIMHVDWHTNAGFVVIVFENVETDGFYPIIGAKTGQPEFQIGL